MVTPTSLLLLIFIAFQLSGVSQPWKANAAWGDSLTAGNEDHTGVSYPNVLSPIINEYVYNGGVGGQTSVQIYARMLVASTTFSRWPEYCTIIWAGRNNVGSQALSDVASMVALAPIPNCNLVLSVLNGETLSEQKTGGPSYNNIISFNNSLAAAHAGHYLDIRAALVANGDPSNPLDVWDQVQDVPVSSMRAQATGTVTAVPDTSSCSFTWTVASGYQAWEPGDVIQIDSEYIYVTTATGSSPTFTVTACIRGYANSTAATHANGATYNFTAALHLGAAGYTFVAQQVAPLIKALRP